MFTTQADQKITSIGEVELIRRIGLWLGEASPAAPEGMGDDCAVHSKHTYKHQLLTTDSLTYGQHFDDSVCPEHAGSKLIKRNLSDIAAMGGTPGPALLNLLCGRDLSLAWLQRFIEGVRTTCLSHDVIIAGGDISGLNEGQFSAVLMQTGYANKPLLRSKSEHNDSIYVTGTLGGSILKKHYAFEPRLAEGQWLAESGQTHAMIDITDGLAKDLREILPADGAAWIESEKLPFSDDVQSLKGDPLEHVFCDGEDYELLFTLKSDVDRTHFEEAWSHKFPKTRLTCIGTIGPRVGDAELIDATTKEALPWQKGFEHLSKNERDS